ncbi:Z1 domain-containing protein [Lyngbya aestuarii]|uniref:Z1 domain-containing protein n=1 Tax=Lyngbya aestuarii TaxID=118322 RepID=UPI00403D8622
MPNIESLLKAWEDPLVPEAEKQIALLSVMKQKNHLQALKELLEDINLEGVPVLVIDDEADQAGLNNKINKGSVSSLYRHLTEIRRSLPSHTFLQYTATPQAPLLINITDVLSPDFVELLKPGAAYTGGNEFFRNRPDLVKTIPDQEISTKNKPLTEPPNSFLSAMMVFYLGVASAYVLNERKGNNRSMMVHPSRETDPHGDYFKWAKKVKEKWENLNFSVTDSAPQNLRKSFKKAYDELEKTVLDLPSFEKLIEVLPRAIRDTNIQEVNSVRGKTPSINWKNDYAHILVGGQAMDRGFTVEGLTVTYMPRSVGVGNADTIQQRARFFGYKKSYLGYCRVYLEKDVQDAYKKYVEHEKDIHRQLSDYQGKPF